MARGRFGSRHWHIAVFQVRHDGNLQHSCNHEVPLEYLSFSFGNLFHDSVSEHVVAVRESAHLDVLKLYAQEGRTTNGV